MAKTRIGISGWRYTPWRGVFYPTDLAQRRELEFASRQFPTIELNGSFYSLQRPENYQAWYDETPKGFVFAVKGPRFITHMLRLKNIDAPLANFFASGVLALREKLGPMLWQFPPNFRFDPSTFEAFLAMLPSSMEAAARLGRGHDAHLKREPWLQVETNHRMRHAVEIRHESFVDPAFIALLRKYGVGFVVADTAGKFPRYFDVTAPFVYVRLHGDKKLYASGYGDAALADWARRIRAWRRGAQPSGDPRISRVAPAKRASRDVYVYFDNDMKVKAPRDARSLIALV
ncbi:Uncharacterized conserved protein YecE, DUF72 family [Luteibacter sp. UNC138MFCol5.1]|uniref:DUF72 domain-containing protein n=1 Tax=Luteibacter sp. UNC138MFCol5.1 TaxID=1502774 RepID=UPI0008B63157|nr:DUF72 domain-containing protein [Luteibacter sp. UNC138MFCol5.1]SEP02293.1 Uncharacterized conserved protein YecE, DUF72 family [Luteibacter sp. UNC138MFCol5.1]